MATPFNSVTDFSKMLEGFNFPGVDTASLMSIWRKDFEAIAEANRLAYEGMQALVRKQTDILSTRAQEIQSAARQMSAGDPKELMAKQGEFVQRSSTEAFENMREMAEMAQKSQAEALAAITTRAGQSMQEAKTSLRGAQA
jgi:phasin family protein